MKNKLILLFFLAITHFNSVFSQQIIQLDGKFALLDKNNNLVLRGFDSIKIDLESFDDDNPLYLFYKDRKYSFVFQDKINQVKWADFDLEFDYLSPIVAKRTTTISFIVKLGDKYAVVNKDKEFVTPLDLDTAYQHNDYKHIVLLRRNKKLDFLDVVLDIHIQKELKFNYDELIFGSRAFRNISFRINNKYGCYYEYFNGNRYKVGYTEAIYDSIFKPNGYFFSTYKDNKQQYLHIPYYRMSDRKTYEFELYFSDTTTFTDIINNTSMIYYGKNRNEKVMYSFPNLFIDYMNPSGFEVFDLTDDKKIDCFKSDWNKSIQLTRMTIAKDKFHPEENYEVLLYWVRIESNEGAVEKFYSVENLKEVFSYEMKINQKLSMTPLETNNEYFELFIVDQERKDNGKIKKYKRLGYYSAFYNRVESTRPTSERKIDFSGGGSRNNKWMDAIWFGGR